MTCPSGKHGKGHVELSEGNLCLLSVMRQYFMVEIVEVGEQSLKLSFPGRDYPVEGMPVDLQFHDKTGFYSYPSVVMRGPDSADSGIEVR